MTGKSRRKGRSGRKTKQTQLFQHEDAVLKWSMQCFAEELLPYLGIEDKVEAVAPTETVHMEVMRSFRDYNFIMKDGSWKHFEFQSRNEGIPGLKRFRIYEAVTSYHSKAAVTTYVLYSGKIKRPVTKFTEGLNTYQVYPIIMQDHNADELFQKLERKMESGETITKKDLVPLILSPLMSGKSSQRERFREAYRITGKAEKVDREEVQKIEAAMYAMADKFLERKELKELQEVIRMTTLGQMLFDDGWQEGIKEGRQAGIKEGRQEGIKEGRQEGIKEGRQAGIKEGRQEGIIQGLAVGIRNLIETCREFGEKKEEIVRRIMKGFEKTFEEAELEVEKYWE